MAVLQAILGLCLFCVLAWCFSENRRALTLGSTTKLITIGIATQFCAALILLKVPVIADVVMGLNALVIAFEQATAAGTSFVFGFLGGGPLPFSESHAGASFILAFRALPIILLVSALSALLFYWGVLPFIVKQLARALQRLRRRAAQVDRRRQYFYRYGRSAASCPPVHKAPNAQ